MAGTIVGKVKTVKYDDPVGQSDILRPVIVHYDGMSFRKCATTYRGYRPPASHQTNSSYIEEDEEEDGRESCCMDKIEDVLDITELSDGKYETEVTVPSVFYKYIIGKQGRTKQMIENDTKAKIFIPKQGIEGPIKIQAATKRSLSSAKRRIEVIAWSNRQNEEPTHFIGIALSSDVTQQKVAEFKHDVLHTCANSEGVEESIFQMPIKMHLTLSMLRLFSDKEEREAMLHLEKIVEKCKSSLANRSPLPNIVLRGIDCMNDDHSSVDVIYARVSTEDNSQVLQKFADSLVHEMIAQIPDLVKEERRTDVKLHATVMNSKWRRDDRAIRTSSATGRSRRQARISFDATKIFKEYNNYDFGSCKLTEVMLLDRREKDKSGFYKCTKSFQLVD